jgi:uncharacterized protein YhaN
MRFLELHLGAFGPFTDERIDFVQDRGDARGVHLIYGPNEAGKSSALRAIRCFLFGLPNRTNDNFVHENTRLRIGARLEGLDEREFVGVRRKGLKKTLRHENDRDAIEESELRTFLGTVDENAFTRFFGIDHEALVTGGQEILRGGGEIGHMIFAASGGFSGLQNLLDQLQDEADVLFKPLGKRPAINVALARIAELRRNIKQSSLPSDTWKAQQAGLVDTRNRLKTIQDELRSTTRENHRLRRIRDALPIIAQRTELLVALDGLGDVPLLPEDFGDRRRDSVSPLRTERANTEALKEQLASLDDQIAKIDVPARVPARVIEQRDEIDRLHAGLTRFRQAAGELPVVRADREQARARATRQLTALRSDVSLDAGDSVDVHEHDRKRILRLSSQYEALVHGEKAARQKRDELNELLERDRRNLAETENNCSESDPESLRAVLRDATRHGDLDDRLEAARAERTVALEGCESRLDQLRHVERTQPGLDASDAIEAVARLRVPDPVTVDTRDAELKAIEEDQRRIEARIAQCEDKREEHAAEEKTLLHQLAVLTEADLLEARKQRDHAWQIVRAKYIDDSDIDEAAVNAILEAFEAAKLEDGYEASVQRSDEIADRLRREADRVAKLAHAIAGREKCNEELKRLRQSLGDASADGIQSRLDSWRSEWQALWKESGIDPQSPGEMRTWLRAHERIRDDAETLRNLTASIRELERAADSTRHQLDACLSDLKLDPPSGLRLGALMEHCESVVHSIEEGQRERHQQRELIKEREQQLVSAENQLSIARSERKTWQDEWSRALQPLDLKEDTTPEEAREVLDRVDEFGDQLRSLRKFEGRVRKLEIEVQDYEDAIRRLSAISELDIETSALDVVVQDLVKRLSLAQASLQEQKHLEERRQEESARLERTESRIRELESDLESLCEEAGCDTAEELPDLERRSQQRRKLERDLQHRNERLLELSGGQTVDALIQETEGEDADTLDHRIEEIGEQVSRHETRKSELDREFGRQEKELEDLNETACKATANELSEEMHSVLAGISDKVEQYSRLVLARWILKRSIERYREKNQGPVLRRAREIFARLTLGSFVDLEEDYDDSGNPILRGVRNGDGRKIVPIDGMSEGTRDQLYLALRLASLEHYLEDHPPVPFIADDLLVNFDDARSQATLEILTELSKKTQVIFFTHHAHLIELAHQAVPSEMLRVHELGRSKQTIEKVHG